MRVVLVLALLVMPSLVAAQTAVDLNAAKFAWDWTQGTGGAATEFRIKCGPNTGTYPTVVSVAPSVRQVPVVQVIGGSGTYFCVVTAANQYGESPPSGEINFTAGVIPSSPSNLRVTP